MGAIVIQRKRIGDTAAGEGKPCLTLEERMLLGAANAQRMKPAIKKTCRKQSRDICGGHRAISDPALRRLDLHKRLEPVQPSRAVTNERYVDSAGFRRLRDRCGNPLGADGNGRSIARHENLHRLVSAMIASSLCGVSRPTGSPPIIAAGAHAQRPRQKVCSSVTRPSCVVSPQSTPSRALAWP